MTGEIFQAANPADFPRRAAELIAAAGREAVAARGRFTVALTGGRTVQPLYRQLATAADTELRGLLRRQTDYFWGDERWVDPGHPDSNFALARRLLLDELMVPVAHLHPVPTSLPDPVLAALAYEESLRDFVGFDLRRQGLPVFDLILLGLGPDGHVASLFPGAAALAEQQRWVVGVAAPKLAPPVARVSLTLPVLNRARMVLLLVAGAERVALARRICRGASGTGDLPAALLRPAGRLVWLLLEES
ncbi:MAG: 6-phosphogluconolactonase [Desulfobulbaceae bacterium]|nr:6-phosphogluconolactonase [Desulfobulbaceae bacterium]